MHLGTTFKRKYVYKQPLHIKRIHRLILSKLKSIIKYIATLTDSPQSKDQNLTYIYTQTSLSINLLKSTGKKPTNKLFTSYSTHWFYKIAFEVDQPLNVYILLTKNSNFQNLPIDKSQHIGKVAIVTHEGPMEEFVVVKHGTDIHLFVVAWKRKKNMLLLLDIYCFEL